MTGKILTEERDYYGIRMWYAQLKTGESGKGFYGSTEAEALAELTDYLAANDRPMTVDRVLNQFFFKCCEWEQGGQELAEKDWVMDRWNAYELMVSGKWDHLKEFHKLFRWDSEIKDYVCRLSGDIGKMLADEFLSKAVSCDLIEKDYHAYRKLAGFLS